MISILFADTQSHYYSIPGLDVWNVNRNALNFNDSNVCIVHPPCRLFSRLKSFSTAPAHEKEFAFFAMDKVILNGGIFEHPVGSSFFKEYSLSGRYKHRMNFGFLTSINLSWFGYPAVKKTLLYFHGIKRSQVLAHPLQFDAITHVVGSNSRSFKKPEVKKSIRHITPLPLCFWLVENATIIEHNKISIEYLTSQRN